MTGTPGETNESAHHSVSGEIADVPGMKVGVVSTAGLHLCCLLTITSSITGIQVENVTLVKWPWGVITTSEVVLTTVGEEETRKDVSVGLVKQIVDISTWFLTGLRSQNRNECQFNEREVWWRRKPSKREEREKRGEAGFFAREQEESFKVHR